MLVGPHLLVVLIVPKYQVRSVRSQTGCLGYFYIFPIIEDFILTILVSLGCTKHPKGNQKIQDQVIYFHIMHLWHRRR